ncbi:MAG: hypothetical protein DRN27_10030 [Thermoplasmata archaeon]|nr:MAG: hypothetical protein DRN27_10030 [Thermoplasmata archaeon]
MKRTIVSEIQPEYAVSYYSIKKHGNSGAGFYLHKTDDPDNGYCELELVEMGASPKTVRELREVASIEVFGKPLI